MKVNRLTDEDVDRIATRVVGKFVRDDESGFHLRAHLECDMGVAVMNADPRAAGLIAVRIIMRNVMVVIVLFSEHEKKLEDYSAKARF